MSFLGDIFNILTGIGDIFNSVDTFVSDLELLVSQVKGEIAAIKRFKQDPKWKTRVINVPTAFKSTRDFVLSIVEEIHNAFNSLVQNLKAIKANRPPISDPRAGGGGGVGTIISDITRIKETIQECDNAVKALSSFVQALREIRGELETFDTLFLGQGNLRKRLTGAKPFIRLGKLHPSA